MESRRRCTGKVEGDLVIFLFPSQCGRYGSADHRFDYFVSVSDIFVTLVYVGHAAAVYIALHAALDDILVCGHDTGSFVAYLPQARVSGTPPRAKSSIGSIAGVLCSLPNVTTKPLSCR